MIKWSGRYAFFVATTVLCAAGAAWLLLAHFVPAPPDKITIAAGTKGGAYEFYANKYREILARNHVVLDIRTTEGTNENLRLIEDPASTQPSSRAASRTAAHRPTSTRWAASTTSPSSFSARPMSR